MIMNETPYFNEPGFGTPNIKDPNSIDYNKNVSLQTVRWAMIDWLTKDHLDGFWGECIKAHFSILGRRIKSQIQSWASVDPRMRNYHESTMTLCGTTIIQSRSVGSKKGMDLIAEFDRRYAELDTWTANA